MRQQSAGYAVGMILLVLLGACSEGDSTAVGNGGSAGGLAAAGAAGAGQGGTAGASQGGAAGAGQGGAAGAGQAGAAGTGQSGSAGDGGTNGVGGAPGQAGTAGVGGAAATARFQVTAEGEQLRLIPLDPVWTFLCENNIQAVLRVKGGWTALRDDRPPEFNGNFAAHYRDGTFQSDCALSLGCDVTSCAPLPSEPDLIFMGQPLGIPGEMIVSAREIVQVGQRAAPTCDEEAARDAGIDAGGLDAGPDAGGRQVPLLESRTPTSPLGIRVRYYRNSSCSGDALTAEVPVE